MVKNKSHTLAYSLIALQEMNLAYKYPLLFWNCACLISDAGGVDDNDEDDEIEDYYEEEIIGNELEEFTEDDEENIEDEYIEDEDCDGYPAEIVVLKDGKKKKKSKPSNYGKIASAIGRIKSTGVNISSPSINDSDFTFSPDVENNTIRYGLSGITRVGKDLVRTIMDNRPYSSLEDFLKKVKINKPQMINLIKSGALDCFGDRVELMHQYVNIISDTKKRITLQNMKMLIDFNLIPEEYDLQRRSFNFNKYIKKRELDDIYYDVDNVSLNFLERFFGLDILTSSEETESGFKIKQTTWDNIYKKQMNIIRPFIQKNSNELLEAVNKRLTEDVWKKYCLGSISKWEMDSIGCYIHEHELNNVDHYTYGFADFFSLPEQPRIEKYIPIKGTQIPIFELERIAGTVLDRDKMKKTVTLLTTTGVVTVKLFGGAFSNYDRRISERGADGKKHVISNSVFTRGNKIVVCGLRREDSFICKKYSRTPWHMVELIESVEDGRIKYDYSRREEE